MTAVIEALAGTPNWLAARRGMLTASVVKDALAVLKSGKPSESRTKLAHRLVAERVTGFAVDNYVTPAMQWGIDHQSEAIAEYEARTGNIVGPEAFFQHPTIDWFGATPDGLIGGDGLIEVKCPTTPTHVAWTLAGEVPEEHRLQMLAQLACTGRKWVDFVSFDPRIPTGARLFIRRFEPDRADIERVEEGAREFLELVAAMTEQLEMA